MAEPETDENDEWVVSLSNPKFTPELRTWLHTVFDRLAELNVRLLYAGREGFKKLTKRERLEHDVLLVLHGDVRFGRGTWASYKGREFFDRKYDQMARLEDEALEKRREKDGE